MADSQHRLQKNGGEMKYVHTGENRPIRVYESVDQRFIHEDFFAKLAGFAKE
jgi:purine nucleosidase